MVGNAPSNTNLYPRAELLDDVAEADQCRRLRASDAGNEILIKESALGGMKRGAVLVNIARGMLVDEAALAVTGKLANPILRNSTYDE